MSVLRHTRWGSAVGRSSTRTQADSVAEPRGRRPPHRRPRGDGGFTLIEMMVALTLVTVVMAALTVLFVNTMSSVSHLRAKQVATSVASSAIDKARGLGALGSESGRDSSSVSTQFASFSTTPAQSWLTTMTAAADSSASAGQGQTACSSSNPTGRCADLPTVPVVQSVNGQSFSTSYLVGTCWRAGTDTSTSATCGTTKPTGGVQYFRVVVVVSWTDSGCSANTCYFITAVLLNGLSDPTFNFNSTPPAKPDLTGCTNQTVVVGDVLNLPVIKQQSTDTSFVCALSGGVPPFTWTTSGLPSGISLDQTGHFVGTVGTPTGTKTSTVTATDAFLRSDTGPSFTWTVNPGVSIAGTPPTAGMVGASLGSVTLTASGGLASPYTWNAAGLPPGISLTRASNTTATITGSPTTAGTYSVTITATDTVTAPATAHVGTLTFTLTVYPTLSIATPSNQVETAGTAITGVPLVVTGGSGSYTVAVNSGTLPGGLSLTGDSVNGYRVTGTPTATTGKTSVVTTLAFKVTDKANTSWTSTTSTFTFTVYAAPTVTVANQTTNYGQAVSYTPTYSCYNTPCTFSKNANLPSWLSIDPNSGVISGTAPTTGAGTTNNITVTITDFAGAAVPSSTFTWTLRTGPVLTNPGDQVSYTGTAVTLTPTLLCPNPSCTFSITGLPTGVSYSTSTGTMSGTPTKAGTYTVTMTVSDSNSPKRTDTEAFTWTVYTAPTLTSPAPQNTGIGRFVSLQVTNSCSNTPCTFAASGLPSGLSIDSGSGLITGSPAATATSAVTVNLLDSLGHSATPVTFTWNVWAAPTIVTPAGQVSTQGTAASLSISSTCSYTPCTYTAGGLPTGLSINSGTGVISGTPTASTTTTTSVVVTVTDPSGNAATTSSFSWTVYALPTIANPGTQKSGIGQLITSLTLTSYCGRPTCSYAVTGLPAGLSFNTTTGTFSGTPSTATSYTVTVTITDTGAKPGSAIVPAY